MGEVISSVLVAFGASLAVVPACRYVALRFGYTAKPKEDRWNRRPTALLGGVAIAITVLGLSPWLAGARELQVLLLGVATMLVVGLVDDLVVLKPYTKLVAEIAIASLFVFFGYRLSWSDSLILDTLLTMFWIVGLTNAFNLLDNMDGLCAGISLIAGSVLLVTFLATEGVTPEARYLAILLGATAGFLVYNFHPASIFMGDSGSLFIGLNLAVLTLGLAGTAAARPMFCRSSPRRCWSCLCRFSTRRSSPSRACCLAAAPHRADVIIRATVWLRLDCRNDARCLYCGHWLGSEDCWPSRFRDFRAIYSASPLRYSC